jgi:hypothetical protein
MTETVSGVIFLAAVYAALFQEPHRPLLGGGLAGLAIFFRYQNGLLAVGLLVLVAARWKRPSALRFALGAGCVGLAGGLLDWITWDYPFEAFWQYLSFNLISGKATQIFGANSLGYYPDHLERSMGATLGLLIFGAAVAARRLPGLVGLILLFVLAHFAIPHKELRFLLPIFPLFITMASVGLTDVFEGEARSGLWTVPVVLLMATAMSLKAFYASNLRDIGRIESGPVWHDGEDFLRAEWIAESKPDLCGIAMVGYYREWMGGYTYLHRNVPIYFDLDHLEQTNYILGGKSESLPDGWSPVETVGDFSLYRRDGTCFQDPEYKTPWLN